MLRSSRRFLQFTAIVALLLATASGRITYAVGTPPAVGDIIFNEYAADNDANGNDFFELLVMRDGVDLRGLRVTDNELLATGGGALNNNESVFVFGDDAYLSDVPKGTLIAVWTIATGVAIDTVVNPAVGDWKMVLAPGIGVASGTDGLGGSTNAGFANGGDALYAYLPGPDGNSGGTDNIYLDFISYEDDGGAVAPAGLVDVNLVSLADNAYYTGNTVAGNDVAANWVRYDFPAAAGTTTPGLPNPTQDLSGLRIPPSQTDLSISLSDSPDPILIGGTLTYSMQVSAAGASATGIEARFTLPASGATFQTATGDSGFTGSESAGIVTFTGGSLAADTSASLTVTVTTTAAGLLTSGEAIVDPLNAIAESNESNNNAAPVATTVQAVSNTLPTIDAVGPLSGVISDPTNPGMSVTIGDAETPASALTVSATNTTSAAVVPLANVTVAGTGSTRIVSVNPVGVGYADLTLTVTDGGGLSSSTVLRYAASAASVTPGTSRFHTGASDASTALAITPDEMLVADDEDQTIRLYSRNASGAPLRAFDFTSVLGLTDLSGGVPREIDIESSTRDGNRIYWVASQGNGSEGQIRVNRYRVFATDLANPGPTADLAYVGRYDHLRADLIAWDDANGHGLGAGYLGFALGSAAGTPPEVSNGTGFNLEGLTIAPDGTTAYLAFRAPLVPISHRAHALIVPLTNLSTLLAGDGGVAGSAVFGSPIELDLGGRGIRSLERNGAGQYLLVAGPVDVDTGVAPKDFRLFTWSGDPLEAPVLHDANLTALVSRGSFESIVEVPSPLLPASPIQLLSDNGDTIWYNDGIIAKDLADPEFKKFRSDLVLLGDPTTESTPAAGTVPVVGDIIFNEYASDNDASGNDFVELLVLRDNLDLRGLRISDNELTGGVLNVNESVLTFGNDTFLRNVPRGTLIAVYTLAAGVTTDTTVNAAAGDWKLVLAPGTGVSIGVDGLGGSTNAGLSTGGEALYLYLPGADGASAGSDNVYLDFVSFEDDQGAAPLGLVDLNLPSVADNAYYKGNTAAGNDFATNWQRYDGAPNVNTTPGEPNPAQDLTPLRGGGGASVVLTESGGSTAVTEGGAADSYTLALSTAPIGPVQIQATASAQIEVSLDGSVFASTVTVTIAGSSPAPIFVRAIDDLTTEGTATATISHSIVTSGDPAYSNTLTPVPTVSVTVTDNDIALTAIHAIQGSGVASPLAGATVTTTGIVTALKSNGFFIQEPDGAGDGLIETSDGILVFTNSTPAGITRGDLVQVTGRVQEFVPSADPTQPPLTEIGFPVVAVLSSGHALPMPVVLTPATTTAPNAVQLLESFEGMRVSVPIFTVVGPTLSGSSNESQGTSTTSGVFYGTVSGVARPFREAGIDINDPLPAGTPCCVPRFDGNPERLRIDSDGQPGTTPLDVSAGVTISGMVGPLDYSFRTYVILPDAGSMTVGANATFTAAPAPSADEVVVAGLNMQRFYDTVNDPEDDAILTPTAFANRLNKASLAVRQVLRLPDVLGVIEMENLSTLQTLATRINSDVVNGGGVSPGYTAYLVEGNDIGGIDVGLLVKNNITVVNVRQEGKDTTFVDPSDGSIDLLNDRPPLVLDARTIRPGGQPFDFTVIVNHLRSLNGVEDPTTGPRVRAKRARQAEYLADLIQDLQTANPSARVLAIGDFNAFEVSDGYVDSIGTIRGVPTPADQVVVSSPDLITPDLTNLLTLLPPSQRYSYVFDGNAQVLDHALASTALMPWVSRFAYARLDADFPDTYRNDPNRPERLSDHDATVTYIALGNARLTGRLVSQTPRAGGQMTVTLQISNAGTGNARNVVLDQIVPRTLTGTGTITLATPLPIAVGDVAAGQSTLVTVTLNVPTTVTRFSLTANGGFADASATAYRFSTAMAVTP
jgi:predicted extracellular nuclease